MFIRVLLLGATLVGLASIPRVALAADQPPVQVDEKKETAPAAAAPKATPAAKMAEDDYLKQAGQPVDPNTYIIGPEDILEVQMWDEPRVDGPVTVRPDGMISLPLLTTDVKAGGLTPQQLKEVVAKAYSATYVNPIIMVKVLDVRSKKYFIMGEVVAPGQYPLVVTRTVLQAITMAGGLREFADKKNITIVRGPKRYKFNYSDVMKGKNLQQNINLESGDEILVP
jgi:polysaccharide export outer membrane protein